MSFSIVHIYFKWLLQEAYNLTTVCLNLTVRILFYQQRFKFNFT